MTLQSDSDAAWRTLGIRIAPRITAEEWRPMERQIAAIVSDQAGAIPWLPPKWLDSVNALAAQYPDMRIALAPALGVGGKRLPDTPAWIDTPAKEQAWQAVYDAMNNAINIFANGMREAGLEEMKRLDSRAWWADKIYLTVKAVADAPATVVGAAGDFATGMLGTIMGRFGLVIVVAIVAWLAWTNKDTISKAAGKRVAKAVEG